MITWLFLGTYWVYTSPHMVHLYTYTSHGWLVEEKKILSLELEKGVVRRRHSFYVVSQTPFKYKERRKSCWFWYRYRCTKIREASTVGWLYFPITSQRLQFQYSKLMLFFHYMMMKVKSYCFFENFLGTNQLIETPMASRLHMLTTSMVSEFKLRELTRTINLTIKIMWFHYPSCFMYENILLQYLQVSRLNISFLKKHLPWKI